MMCQWGNFAPSPISIRTSFYKYRFASSCILLFIVSFDCDDHKKVALACNELARMCQNGISKCVKASDINSNICLGWKLGPCAQPGAISARSSVVIPGSLGMPGEKKSIPQEYKVFSYPNPFAIKSTIQYELPFDSKVSIKVYDLAGRVLATLVDEYKMAGIYKVDFNAGRSIKGSLYYKVIASSKDGKFQQTNKMIQVQ